MPTSNRPRRPEGRKTTKAVVLSPSGTLVFTLHRWIALSTAPTATLAAAACVTFFALGRRLAELLDPARAVRVMAHHHIAPHNALHFRIVQRIRDRRRHAGTHRHGKERCVHAMPVRQSERKVRCAARGVYAQFFTQSADQVQRLCCPASFQGADRHHQRIDDDVGFRDAEVRRALDNFFGDFKADVRDLRRCRSRR